MTNAAQRAELIQSYSKLLVFCCAIIEQTKMFMRTRRPEQDFQRECFAILA
jgi:hypothetical protein